MPRKSKLQRSSNANAPAKRRNSKRPAIRRRPIKQNVSAHRRFVLYPATSESSWLDKLSWFASIALSLISTVLGVNDDLTIKEAVTGSGTIMLLGPGDFATFSPFASETSPPVNDKELLCLKTFPFERCALRKLTVSIVPSADLGQRGGMYAALLIPLDVVDSEMLGSADPSILTRKFSYTYDDIIKHPYAKMAPVTSSLVLRISIRPRASNIRVDWDDKKGFTNAYPAVALMVAFSDLASKEEDVMAGYSPAKSLFEIHAKAGISFLEPAETKIKYDQHEIKGSQSFYTSKILTTNSTNINASIRPNPLRIVTFFGKKFTTQSGYLSLADLPSDDARQILYHYDREDLLSSLEAARELKAMEI